MDRERLREQFQKQIQELDTDKLETMALTELFGLKDRLIKAGLREEYDDLYWKIRAIIKEKKKIKFAPSLITHIVSFFSSIGKSNKKTEKAQENKGHITLKKGEQLQKDLLLPSKKWKSKPEKQS